MGPITLDLGYDAEQEIILRWSDDNNVEHETRIRAHLYGQKPKRLTVSVSGKDVFMATPETEAFSSN